MKLYKYVGQTALSDILRSQTIGFSRASTFNDPFDVPFAQGHGHVRENIPTPRQDPKLSGLLFFTDVWLTQAKERVWEENTAILSLSSTFLNPLMWSHYADSHRGAVLEIDCSIAGFEDEETNFIPAHYGRVVYTSHRDMSPLAGTREGGIRVGQTHHFPVSHYEKLQRTFLTKSVDWSYEEEVRIVKCIHGLSENCSENKSGLWTLVSNGESTLYCYKLPEHSVSKVFLGVRAGDHFEQLCDQFPNIKFVRCGLDAARFSISPYPD